MKRKLDLPKFLGVSKNWLYDDEWAMLDQQYNQKHRQWHNWSHIKKVIDRLYKTSPNVPPEHIVAAIYHDAIYVPGATNNENEVRSAHLFEKASLSSVLGPSTIEEAKEWIVADPAKYFDDPSMKGNFIRADWNILLEKHSSIELIEYENAIAYEYQFAGYSNYKAKRLEFLEAHKKFIHPANMEFLADYIRTRVVRVGLYAGSFAPFHVGHLSVLRQAENIFDMVYLAVGCNLSKPDSVASLGDRAASVSKILPFHRIETFSGFLYQKAAELAKEGLDVTIVRGLRTDTDFKAEERDLRISNDLCPDIKVVFLMCEKEFDHVSSTAIRQLNGMDGKAGQRYVPTMSDVYGGGIF